MIWIGLAIVVVTFYLIYKNYEARLVLALSGLVMASSARSLWAQTAESPQPLMLSLSN
mgnify:CR=1 FL=1